MTGTTVFLIIISVAAFIVFLVVLHRRSKADLKTFASELGVEEMKSGVAYAADLAGQKYQYKYDAGGKNRPSSFKIWLDCASTAKFHITRESRWDAFFKRLGLSTEIQTGDVSFDDACYIRTDFTDFTKRFFMASEKRHAVLRLIEHDYKIIEHDGTSMTATMMPFRINEDRDKMVLESVVCDLATLTKSLPSEYPTAQVFGVPAWKFWQSSISLVTITSVLVGLVLILWALGQYTVLDEGAAFVGSLKNSVLVLIVFMTASVFLLKGRSSSHNDMILAFVFAVIGFPMCGYGAMLIVNGSLDNAEPQIHQAKIVDKRISSSGKSTSRYIYVASWRESGSRESIKVGSYEYKRFEIGKTLQITTQPGKLGYEWMADYKLSQLQD